MSEYCDINLPAIGVFDSGYGGLSVLRDLVDAMPQYRFVYLGDNARAPYGTRSFDLVYDFTLQATRFLWEHNCALVILACNTASAKALRTIQQRYLPYSEDPTRRVLGVIRPTVEHLATISTNGHIGIVATPGTIASHSYDIEIAKTCPEYRLTSHACPMWVPLVENGQLDNPGTDYFVKADIQRVMEQDPEIDTLILGCTHYPLLVPVIRRHLPEKVRILTQGRIVAPSLADYLRRHPEMDERVRPDADLTPDNRVTYLTTDLPERFDVIASTFMGKPVRSRKVIL